VADYELANAYPFTANHAFIARKQERRDALPARFDRIAPDRRIGRGGVEKCVDQQAGLTSYGLASGVRRSVPPAARPWPSERR
jgi:hypothetical protein